MLEVPNFTNEKRKEEGESEQQMFLKESNLRVKVSGVANQATVAEEGKSHSHGHKTSQD